MSTDDAHLPDIPENEQLIQMAGLPTPELAPGVSERVRRRTRAAFIKHRDRARHPWFDRLSRIYEAFEPVMAVGVASAYMLWAFSSAMSLYQ